MNSTSSPTEGQEPTKPIQTRQFWQSQYSGWDQVANLIEHYEAMGRFYTIEKKRQEQTYYTTEGYTYEGPWWWPFKRRVPRSVKTTRTFVVWTVEEWL